jgi:hypothetical protein
MRSPFAPAVRHQLSPRILYMGAINHRKLEVYSRVYHISQIPACPFSELIPNTSWVRRNKIIIYRLGKETTILSPESSKACFFHQQRNMPIPSYPYRAAGHQAWATGNGGFSIALLPQSTL